jgi:replicative DNA helicase
MAEALRRATVGKDGQLTEREMRDHFAVIPASDRVEDEAARRAEMASRAMRYNVGFLDDMLRGILLNDMIVLGADTGVGKTQMALNIAAKAAMLDKRNVTYFALEAEEDELERRLKYRHFAEACHARRLRTPAYVDWYLGRVALEHRAAEDAAHGAVRANYQSLRTFYRTRDEFTAESIPYWFAKWQDYTDLFVLDHLHYLDSQDENEQRALRSATKTLRDTALVLGKPVIAVAHLRKRGFHRGMVPDIEEFHGSSELTKICTHAIMFARAPSDDSDPPGTAPTFMHVPKDRRAGATGYVARCLFDFSTQSYRPEYQLGRMRGDAWAPIQPSKRPDWAAGHVDVLTEEQKQ